MPSWTLPTSASMRAEDRAELTARNEPGAVPRSGRIDAVRLNQNNAVSSCPRGHKLITASLALVGFLSEPETSDTQGF